MCDIEAAQINGYNPIDDDICEICSCWCTYNSLCSKRYNLLYGCFNDREYTDDWCKRSYGPDSIPICDKCMTHYNIEDCEEINILGRTFQIDVCVRIND